MYYPGMNAQSSTPNFSTSKFATPSTPATTPNTPAETPSISAPAPSAPSATPSATDADGLEQLKALKVLVDSGVITQADFDAKKKQILGL